MAARGRRERERERGRRERGQALIVVLVFGAVSMAISMGVMTVALTNPKMTGSRADGARLSTAARSGLAHAHFLLWNRYNNYVTTVLSKNAPGNITDFRGYLDPTSITPNASTTGTIGALLGSALAPGATITLADLALPAGSSVSGFAVDVPVWVRVTAERRDIDVRNTYVVIRSEATTWNTAGGTITAATRAASGLPSERRLVERVLHFGGPPFEGFKFALLANAINCTFCHTHIDNANRVYNTDPAKYGTFPRVKVASLESMEMRTGSTSRIAGTLYAQGSLLSTAGTVLTPSSTVFTSGTGLTAAGLKAAQIDTNGKITENSNATAANRLTITNFTDSTKDGNGDYNQTNGSFYRNYPTDPAKQVDGLVPDKFPPVIPDDNGNRKVDDAEWTAKIGGGTFTGTLAGGSARLKFPKDGSSPYTGTSLPTSGSDTIPAGGTTGESVILVGTATNPITIDGDVAIDGDVVISGVVKGKGSLTARGNVYILGDLQYADGTDGSGNRTLGVAQDGTENLVAYAAGGNIIHGTYLGSRYKKSGSTAADNAPQYNVTGEGNEVMSGGTPNVNWDPGWGVQEIAWWNRTEWTKSMPYYDNVKKMPTAFPQRPDGTANAANIAYVPNYKPRFYTLKENGKIWFYGPDNGKTDWTGAQTRWDNTNGLWMGDGDSAVYKKSRDLQELFNTTMVGQGASGNTIKADFLSGAAYTTMALDPKFISQANFRSMQVNSDIDRKAANGGNKAYRLDGLFYTNNAMLFMARKSYGSSDGRMEFNGAVVAADTGVLAGKETGGNALKLHYDIRTSNHFVVEDTTEVSCLVTTERERQ